MYDTEQLIKLSAASRALGLPYHSFSRLVRLGRIPSVTIGGIPFVRLSVVKSAILERGSDSAISEEPAHAMAG